MAKALITIGIIFMGIGLLWHFTNGNIPLGRLPGDIYIKHENTQVFIPLTSSILVSILLSLIIYFIRR